MIGTNALAYAAPSRWAFTAACLVVSWGWFLGLAAGGRLLGDAIATDGRLRYLNAISAGAVWAVALFMAWRLLGRVGRRRTRSNRGRRSQAIPSDSGGRFSATATSCPAAYAFSFAASGDSRSASSP
ncbi:hypothetical protein U4E84_16920 [Halorubrum sp. AD140]|uniref:hypothetical protein n=1 Tax=Halorubrum sp. AD140 TaxID=3050073 RepID=UPI002ACD1DF5|nr:hypothetical protein [Halorubrum sp. AD140]MDZ5813021.1 hypothetical protein [Halorubrum sp. AD140]